VLREKAGNILFLFIIYKKNRSSTIVVSFIAWKLKLSIDEALKYVQKFR